MGRGASFSEGAISMSTVAQHAFPRFNPGQVVMTSGVASLVQQGQLNPRPYLFRHLSAAWGDHDASDRRQNDAALPTGEDRLVSSYEAGPSPNVWSIPEVGKACGKEGVLHEVSVWSGAVK